MARTRSIAKMHAAGEVRGAAPDCAWLHLVAYGLLWMLAWLHMAATGSSCLLAALVVALADSGCLWLLMFVG